MCKRKKTKWFQITHQVKTTCVDKWRKNGRTIKCTGECDGKCLTVAGRGWRSSSVAEPAGLACSKALSSTGMGWGGWYLNGTLSYPRATLSPLLLLNMLVNKVHFFSLSWSSLCVKWGESPSGWKWHSWGATCWLKGKRTKSNTPPQCCSQSVRSTHYMAATDICKINFIINALLVS